MSLGQRMSVKKVAYDQVFRASEVIKSQICWKIDKNCYQLSKIDVYNNNYRLCIDWKLDFIIIGHLGSHFKLNLEMFITKFVDKWLKILVLIQLNKHNWKTRQITEWWYGKTLCRSLVICKGFFRMTTLWFDEFFNAHSYLILNITNFWLLNLEFLYVM